MDDTTRPHLFIPRRDRVKTPESLSHTLMRNLSSVPGEIFGHNRPESYSYQPSYILSDLSSFSLYIEVRYSL